MTKIHFKKKILKIAFVILVFFVFLPGIAVASFGGVNYFQAKGLIKEGQNLESMDKLDEASEKFALAGSKWIPESLSTEVEINMMAVKGRIEDRDIYDKGVELFDTGKYQEAKDQLAKVSGVSKYFADAQDLLSRIETRLKITNQVKTTKTIVSTSRQPTSNPNKDSICKNEAELFKMQEKERGIAMLKEKVPWLFWTPSQLLANGYSQSDLQYVYPGNQKQLQQVLVGLDGAIQKEYLIKYNECLQK